MAASNVTHNPAGIAVKLDYGPYVAANSHIFAEPVDASDAATKNYVDARSYSREFTNGDLSASGILTVAHNLGQKICGVTIASDGDDQTGNPGRIHYVDTNSLTVDFSAFQPLSGTWAILVQK
jgi:hypothetical protein